MNRRVIAIAAAAALTLAPAALAQTSTPQTVTIRNVVQQLQPDGTWKSIHFGPAVVVPVAQAVTSGTTATTTTTSTSTTTTSTTTTTVKPSTLSVAAYGAKPDDELDDTAALAAAFKDSATTGKTVTLPCGTYIARDVPIGPGMTIDGGSCATIKRPAMQGKWAHTLTTATATLYFGATDSKPLVIRNLALDGNAAAQGPYEAYQLEQAHLIYLDANPGAAGRLKALVENVTLRDAVADGISVYRNVDATLRNIRADRVFRGGVVLTGGYSKVDVDGLITTSTATTWWRTGIDVEVDAPGYGATFATTSSWRNLNLDGDLDINVGEHATAAQTVMTFDGVTMAQGPLTIVTPAPATITITRSTLAVGKGTSDANRLVYGSPGLTISDSTINVGDGGAFWLYWALGCCVPAHPAKLTLRNVTVVGNNAECAFRRQIGVGTLDLGGVVFTGRFACGTFVN